MNGAATNPDAHAFAHAAAQVKKGLEIAKKLGAENFGRSSNMLRVNNMNADICMGFGIFKRMET